MYTGQMMDGLQMDENKYPVSRFHSHQLREYELLGPQAAVDVNPAQEEIKSIHDN